MKEFMFLLLLLLLIPVSICAHVWVWHFAYVFMSEYLPWDVAATTCFLCGGIAPFVAVMFAGTVLEKSQQ